MKSTRFAVALLTLSCSIWCVQRAVADSFGAGPNAFTIDFVPVGNPGNAADTTGDPNPAGAVGYSYRMGRYEVSRDMVNKANAAGGLTLQMADMSSTGGNGPNQPAVGISWFDAAKFVNYLNTSSGSSPAYKFNNLGLMELWQPSDPGYDANNRFRNTRARYFLPSTNEWYKSAYYNPSGSNYVDYATGSNAAPTAVASGTAAGTAVWNQPFASGPASITQAGGLSAYGTMAQSGNVYEWQETEYDLVNDTVAAGRTIRGGNWDDVFPSGMSSTIRSISFGPSSGDLVFVGFRVASVIPEPSSFLLCLLASGGLLFRRRG